MEPLRVPLLTILNYRYRRASLPPFSNVLLRNLQSCGYGRHAHAWSKSNTIPTSLSLYERTKLIADLDNRNPSLANNKPVPERCHKQRQRQQIHPSLHQNPYTILLPRRQRLLLRCSRSQRSSPTPAPPLTKHKTHTLPPRTLCGRSIRRGSQCFPNARRGD